MEAERDEMIQIYCLTSPSNFQFLKPFYLMDPPKKPTALSVIFCTLNR